LRAKGGKLNIRRKTKLRTYQVTNTREEKIVVLPGEKKGCTGGSKIWVQCKDRWRTDCRKFRNGESGGRIRREKTVMGGGGAR